MPTIFKPPGRSPAATWRRVGTALLATTLLGLSACGGDPETEAGQSSDLETIEAGVLKVAIQPYAPYTEADGERIAGLDGEILHAIADKLGLEVQTQVTDFAGMLAGVQSERVDITIGGVAWTEERQQQGLFTDPPYYSPPAMAVKGDATYETVADLENKSLGTVEGYVWVQSIQAVPGAELHAYPDGTGVFDDLGAGRIDVGFLDPLIIIAAQEQRPELEITTQYLTPPTNEEVAANPEYEFFQPYMTSFYLPQEATKLEAAISEEIRAMFASGELSELIEKFGGDPQEFLKPSDGMAETRRGVDRADDWEPPTI